MRVFTKKMLALVVLAASAHASAQVTFYENEGFQGRAFTTQGKVPSFARFGFNERASSATVATERWEVCEDVSYRGRCVVLRPGQYPTLAAMGLKDSISSVRAISPSQRIEERRYAPKPAAAQITFYEDERFGGRSFTTDTLVENFRDRDFNDRVSSIVVTGPDQWEACEDIHFSGSCVTLRPGRYPSMRDTGLNDRISSVRNTATKAPAPAPAQITFFDQEGFTGRSVTTDKALDDLSRSGLNDRAASAVVVGEGRWEVCDDARFDGRCMVLRPGQYPSLAAMNMNDRITSVREVGRDVRIDDQRFAPVPLAAPDFRPRRNERLFEVDVTSVKAVVGTPEKRCWVEREQVPQEETKANVPGAIVGALLGGILGHQVGGGTGKDIATAGGVIAGAVIGSKVANKANPPKPTTQDVQRCESVPSQARTQYWDVTYAFRGKEHRIQMTTPPGPRITVNEQGEPRN